MKKLPLVNRSILLPLCGLVLAWFLSMAAQYVSIAANEGYGFANVARPSTYFYLAGFTVAGFASLVAHGWAVCLQQQHEGDGLVRAALRFTTLAVVLSLAVTTIYALTNFLGAFNSVSQSSNIGQRFLWSYLPIILATAVVVFILLRAFVFRTGVAQAEGEEKPKMSERQKALALGFAVPILSTAFAIILGLFIYDATRTNLDTWVWVLIIAIVGIGVIVGTRFSARARAAKVEPPKPKTALAAGAATLNFVLSVIFGTVVSIMSFAMGSGAIENLREWPEWVEGQTEQNYPTLNQPTLGWLFEDFAPALVLLLLAVVGVYLTITERHRKAEALEI